MLVTWTTHYADTPLRDVRLDHLREFEQYLRGQGNGPRTRQIKVRLARRVLKWALKRKYPRG